MSCVQLSLIEKQPSALYHYITSDVFVLFFKFFFLETEKKNNNNFELILRIVARCVHNTLFDRETAGHIHVAIHE